MVVNLTMMSIIIIHICICFNLYMYIMVYLYVCMYICVCIFVCISKYHDDYDKSGVYISSYFCIINDDHDDNSIMMLFIII
jgi:hypothetical protein